jgi:pimeloyl-ACP methyl ester carboxylesterase
VPNPRALTVKALCASLLLAWCACAAQAKSVCESAAVSTRQLVTENLRIAADTPGIELYLRNKRPTDMRAFPAERILLYVHGATYPAETAFDLPLAGLSWMEYIACHGWDVYLVDLRGYGQSTRPPEMARPPEDNAPIVTTAVAVRDVGSAVDYILRRRGASRLNLIGWSWGTAIMGTYAAANPDRVARLVLYAPLWLRETPSPIAADGPLGAYRTVTQDQARKRWLAGVPDAARPDLIPHGWFEAWAQATWATDPDSGKWNPPLLRAPNGVLQDGREYWSAGRPYYDPRAIRAPTLLAVGQWDQDTPPHMAQELFALLEQAAWKRMVLIGAGTHSLIMERDRMQLFREVQLFLDEPPPHAP